MKPRLGSGGRFKKLKSELAAKGADNPGAVAATIGRERYGNKRMTVMAETGKKRAAKLHEVQGYRNASK